MLEASSVSGTILGILTDPVLLLYIFMGTFLGLVFGSLPGLTATMAVALLIPMTYTMGPVYALGIMLGSYVGGIAGGAVSAILLNIPGTPAAVCTVFDGYPMAQQGRAAEALGWAAFASFFGGIFSWLILVVAAPALASIAISFSSPEYAAIAFFGLTIISSVSGKSLIKGMISGFLGLALALIGLDPIWGEMRFNFGVINLMSGINLMPALIGLYSIPQILLNCTEKNTVENINVKLKNFVPSPKKIFKSLPNLIRTSIIGTIVGIIPATGGNVAAYIAYDQAKRFSKDPESFGKGNHEGVIASEAANNSVCGGAMIPLLTLGVPGDSVTAVLLGGLLIHGLTPGPALFVENYNIVVSMFTTMLIGTIAMWLIQLAGIKIFIKILRVPVDLLTGMLVVLSLIGSYALRGNMFDVGVTIVLGLLGYLMVRGKFPVAPAVLGLVLGGMFEREFRLALRTSNGDFSIFFTRPIAGVIIVISFLLVLQNLWKKRKSKDSVEDEQLI